MAMLTGRRRLVCGLVALSLLAAVSLGGAQSRPRYVIVLTSFEQQFSPHNVFKAVFRTELTLRSREPVQFIDVSLPSAQRSAREAEATFEYLKTTFAIHQPDLIVSVGGVAALFAQKYRQEIFPQTPMLFASVDQRFVRNNVFGVNETAVAVAIDPSRIVGNILQVLPDTTTLAVVIGSTQIEMAWRDALTRAFEPYKNRLTFVWFADLPFEDVLTRSAVLPPHSAILFAHLGIDARGVPQVEERALPQLRAAANAPIFGVYDSQVGEGVVGGPVISIGELGRNTASVADRILRGEIPRGLTPPPQTFGAPTFDAAELDRWRIPEHRLPAGSVVLFRQPTAWQRYRKQIIAAAGIGLGQTALVVGLLMLHLKRKRADRLRQESETRFRLLADTAPVMIWLAGDDGKFTDVNRAWLKFTGRTIEQERGDGWAEAIHADDFGAALKAYTTAFDRREPFRINFRLRRFDGEYRWMVGSGTPRFTADGTFVGFTGSAMDMTEHKLAEAALSTLSQKLMRAQEEERARIARDLHDDVCQRIAALAIGLGELRPRLPVEDRAAGRMLDDVSRQVTALGFDVQALSRGLHSSKLELLGLGTAAAAYCRELSAQHKVTIHFRNDGVPPDLPPETALGLFRVTQEALINAVKHSGATEFDVALRGTDGAVSLTVLDRGIGFNPDDVLKKHGLGLVSMRERVSLIGGELLVQSAPGAGTTIRATVPGVTGAASGQSSPVPVDQVEIQLLVEKSGTSR